MVGIFCLDPKATPAKKPVPSVVQNRVTEMEQGSKAQAKKQVLPKQISGSKGMMILFVLLVIGVLVFAFMLYGITTKLAPQLAAMVLQYIIFYSIIR